MWKTPSECVFLTMCMQVESAVRPLLDAYFSPLSGVQVLAQPGCFYVASAFNLAVNVIGKKVVTRHWDSLTQGEILNSLSEVLFVICSSVKSDWYLLSLQPDCEYVQIFVCSLSKDRLGHDVIFVSCVA